MGTVMCRTSSNVGSILLLVAPMLFTGCGDDSVTKPGTYTLTGRVRLVGTVRNAAGRRTNASRLW